LVKKYNIVIVDIIVKNNNSILFQLNIMSKETKNSNIKKLRNNIRKNLNLGINLRQNLLQAIIDFYTFNLPLESSKEKILFEGKRKKYIVVKRYWDEDFIDEDTNEIVTITRNEIILVLNEYGYYVVVKCENWNSKKYIPASKMSLDEILNLTRNIL
jgi:hypothetical protein